MRLSIFGFLGIVALAVAGLFVATLALPHSAYARYQSFQGTIFERLDWIYERIHFDETPIDVLLVGSSRTARGIDAAALEAALAERGQPLRVANISIPAIGFDLRLTKLREALAARPEIEIVVFSLVEAFPRDGHQAFADLAPAREILGAPLLVNRNLPEAILRLPYRQIELAVATALPEAFGYRTGFDPAYYAGTTPDLRLFNDPDWSIASEAAVVHTEAHAAMLEEQSRQRHRAIRPPILPERLSWIEFGVSQTYIDAFLDLTRENDIAPVFLFLPFYKGYAAPIEAEAIRAQAPLWVADMLADDPANFIDSNHVSHLGTRILVPWLADRLADLAEDLP